MKTKNKRYSIRAVWGDGSSHSKINLNYTKWYQITKGAEFNISTWGYYEGKRFSVHWHFVSRQFSILGEDGFECLTDVCIDYLNIEVIP